jgi:LacI family transcriptional regulator
LFFDQLICRSSPELKVSRIIDKSRLPGLKTNFHFTIFSRSEIMPITVKDVAATASVSLGTVSRVLNGDPSVSTEVRQRVREAVDVLGYTRLRSRTRGNSYSPLKGRNIALVMLGMDRSLVDLPSVAAAIHGAEAALKELGANLLLVDLPKADHLPAAIGRNRIDGLLLKGALQGGLLQNGNLALMQRLSQIPTVWFLGKPTGAWGDVVQSNDRSVGQLAAEHLWQQGHRRLAFLSSKCSHATFAQRQAAFQWHARQLGANVEIVLGEDLQWKLPLMTIDAIENVDDLVERLLSAADRPTGLFVPSDAVAAMVYRALAKRGLKVGRDLSLISCNHESTLLAGLYPSLTTIDIHAMHIGCRAVEQLIWRLSHREVPQDDIGVEPTLRLGESVATLSTSHAETNGKH